MSPALIAIACILGLYIGILQGLCYLLANRSQELSREVSRLQAMADSLVRERIRLQEELYCCRAQNGGRDIA